MERYYDIRIPATGHDFEILTRKVCECKFGVPFEIYGRNGQEQNGIDLFSNAFSICVQCKNYQGNDANNRLLASVEKDYLSACGKFGKEMKKYVLATTVQRDTRIQDLVSELSAKHFIEIQVLFWEDFQEILNAYPEIIAEHNSMVFPSQNVDSVCTLAIERNGSNICLDHASVESLKRIYRRFQEKQRYPIIVDLKVKDYDDLSVLCERDDLRQSYGEDFVKYVASQGVRKKYRDYKDVFKTAIEYMLQDEMLDSCALLSRQKYLDVYGTDACIYYDDYGIACYYWTVFLWIEIVEEIIKELVFDRYFIYDNDKGLTTIDCCARTRNGNDLWYFTSHVSNDECNKKKPDMLSRLKWAGCDYLDIPRSELIAHVYPDLFFNIGLFKQRDKQRFDELANNHTKAFNLYYYTFGLH